MKKVAFAIIQLAVITLTLVLVLTTYAWFSANKEVNVSKATVTAGVPSYIVFDSIEDDEIDLFSGQTGQGAPGNEDAPYRIKKILEVTVSNTMGSNAAIAIDIESAKITKQDGSEINISHEDIKQFFTWRLTYHVVGLPDNNTLYAPDDKFFAREAPSVGALGGYINPPTGETSYVISLELVFLGEPDYRLWEEIVQGEIDDIYDEEEKPYEQIEVFPFSDISYMHSMFRFIVAIKLEVPA
ncbi:MAG: hypothetical protein LBT55_03040 [Clostridiaceae bacterium]|jgi:hypothetical protein|nr:hypothetical protein [Clostridiaceae bacterium]